MKSASLTCFLLLFLATHAPAELWHVSADSPNNPGSGSASDPFRTVGQALAQASAGDTIQLAPGVYSGPGNRQIDMLGRAIIITSSDPSDPYVVSGTILDAEGTGPIFLFVSGEDANSIVAGLTLRNASCGLDDSGAAISIAGSSPAFLNCIIEGNSCDGGFGGAIFSSGGNPTFVNCLIRDNTAFSGGAAEIWAGVVSFRNCLFLANTSATEGGAVNCYYDGSVDIRNCTMVANSATLGGAVRITGDGGVTVTNSILWDNTATTGSQISIGYQPWTTPMAEISYTNLQGLGSGVHVDAGFSEPVVIWGAGLQDADPCFVGADPALDPAEWDVRLKSEYGRWNPASGLWVLDQTTSPCIAAGDPASGTADEKWPHGFRINMGACGGTPYASKFGNIADFDLDWSVDYIDLGLFVSVWLDSGSGLIYDLNGDGIVNIMDFALFAQQWKWQK